MPTPESDAQAFTTLGATRTDDCLAAAGLHAYKEAVGALAANHRRLIRAFHGWTLEKSPPLHQARAGLSIFDQRSSLPQGCG